MKITFKIYEQADRYTKIEKPKMYQLNLKGYTPVYYYDKNEALEKFAYLKKHFTNCSLREISYHKTLVKEFL